MTTGSCNLAVRRRLRPHSWRVLALLLGVTVALHGWWNDYSDATPHIIVAFGIIAAAFGWPRGAAAAAGAWIGAIVVAWTTSAQINIPFEVGESRAALEARLGPPDRIATPQQLYQHLDWNYSLPNPQRTKNADEVLIYTTDGGIAYAFMRDNRVVASFAGRS